MKNLILFLLVSMPMLALSSDRYHPSGLYEDEFSRKIFEVKSDYDGLRFREEGRRSWEYYGRVSKKVFKNRRGEKLEIRDDGSKIKWKTRRGHNTLYRINARKSYQGSRDRSYDNYGGFFQRLDGKWHNPMGYGRYRLEETSYGLRLQRTDGRRCFVDKYYRIENRYGEILFQNHEGDKIIPINRNEVEWIGHQGRRTIWRRY